MRRGFTDVPNDEVMEVYKWFYSEKVVPDGSCQHI